MTEPQRSDGSSRKSAPGKSIRQVCALFTSSWEAALKDGHEPPDIVPFLSRVPEADRPSLERELHGIQQLYSKRASPAPVWLGATVDQRADTPCPQGPETIDALRSENDNPPSCDPAATMDHDSQEPRRAESSAGRQGPGLPNAAFSLEEADAESSSAKRKPVVVTGYEIVGELGRGGMGVVYKARQIGLNRWVALKMVLAGAHASPHQLARFLTEAKAVADLQHPNIVQIYDIGQHDGLPYFSLEFVGGGSLEAKVHRRPQPPREAAHMVETLAHAMQYAHEHGIIHRDLKPANILLTVDGMPKITDFGLAKRLAEDSGQTKSGTLMGTPSYMAPEQARGEIQNVGPLADVYTLGAILYELLTGRPPFQAATILETVKQVTNDEPVPPSRLQSLVPRDLETICLKCLEKDLAKRYGSARLLADDLRRFLSDEPILARPVSNRERFTRWCRRNPRIAFLAGTIGLLLIVVACGSLAFAYRLSQEMARTEEQKEIADRNAELEKNARKESDQNAEKAKKAEDLASEQAKLAMQTVLDMVTTADEKLRPVAELGPLRKELLQLAVKQLPQISKDAIASGKVDRTMGIALQRMGRFYEQMGLTDQQTQVIERSLEIFTRLMEEQPQEDWNKFNAAISHEALGEIGRENWADPNKIIFHYNRPLQLRKELVAEPRSAKPDLFLRQKVVAVSYQNWASLALELGDPAKALECAQDALKHSEAAVAADPKKEYDRRELLSYTYLLLGRASLRLAKPTDAQKYLQKSLTLRQEWVKAEPLDDYGKQELGRTLDALGDMETEMGVYSAALDYYQKSHAVFQDLLKRGPNVPEFHWFLANAEYHLGTVHRLMKNEKAAQEDFLSCAKAREALLKDDKTNAQRKVELMLVYARLGRHQEAAKMAQEIIEFAPKHPGKLFSAACGLAICSSADGRAGSLSDGGSGSEDDKAQRRRYAEKAMDTLRLAAANGFKDAHGLQINPDLEALQSLGDYKQLIRQIAKQ